MLLLLVAAGRGRRRPLDDDFLAAREAFRAGDARKLDCLRAGGCKGHILEPYVAYWQLRLRLERGVRRPKCARSSPTHARHAARGAAARRLAEAPRPTPAVGRCSTRSCRSSVGDDLDITCYALQSRHAPEPGRRAARGAPAVVRRPRAARQLHAAFQRARAARTAHRTDDVWTRVRLALEAGQVALAQRASQPTCRPGQAARRRARSTSISSQSRRLPRASSSFDLKSRAGRETAMFAVHRLARTSPQQAARALDEAGSRVSPPKSAPTSGAMIALSRRDAARSRRARLVRAAPATSPTCSSRGRRARRCASATGRRCWPRSTP